MDYTTMVAAVDFATVSTGILTVGIALAGVYIGIKGAKILLRFLK